MLHAIKSKLALYLRKARADISSEEDNANAQGWRNRAIGHIDAAISAARRVFSE